jgi:hypothetical protein
MRTGEEITDILRLFLVTWRNFRGKFVLFLQLLTVLSETKEPKLRTFDLQGVGTLTILRRRDKAVLQLELNKTTSDLIFKGKGTVQAYRDLFIS